jgi:hypothetical protein
LERALVEPTQSEIAGKAEADIIGRFGAPEAMEEMPKSPRSGLTSDITLYGTQYARGSSLFI